MATDRSKGAPDKGSHAFASRADYIVGIGASAGGIPALRRFFAAMHPDSGMTFIVVLHISPDHESQLATILQAETAMPVVQVRSALALQPDTVYVNAPGHQLEVEGTTIKALDFEPERGRRVSIDLLFRTLGESHGARSVCIVLSGTGADGTLGLKRIKESGGVSMVQDPEEAEYAAMPRSAIASGLADFILPVDEMPGKLLSFRERHHALTGQDVPATLDLGAESNAFRDILALLKLGTGHDFTAYKRPTLLRRIARRMGVLNMETLDAYTAYLGPNPDEQEALLRDLLISVTNFFRDDEAFAQLQRVVIPRMFEGKGPADTVRAWTVACATGEEAYSIAMLLSEHASTLAAPPRIQVFASDIDARAIATARAGRYNDTIGLDVSEERLQRFFVPEGDSYRVNSVLRERVLFAHHNVLRDPPFSQQDLITCRNLLIYLDRAAQSSILQVLHFALRNQGYLMLGSSESAENFPPLFDHVDRHHHLYRARPVSGRYASVSTIGAAPPALGVSTHDRISIGTIHHRLVEAYAPPSLLVTDGLEIVHASDHAGEFLHVAGGAVSSSVLDLVLPQLRPALRNAISESRLTQRPVVARPVTRDDKGHASIKLIVRPVADVDGAGAFFLILFEAATALDGAPPSVEAVDQDSATYVQRLEDENQQLREQLLAHGESSEVSDQELRSSNEELQSIIEELRSTGEELETSKEELQSINEELSTVNQELKSKIDEVSIINADLQNLLSATSIATVFLDNHLQIRRFTPLATELFSILDSDLGRPLSDLRHRLEYPELDSDLSGVLKSIKPLEREIRSTDGRSFIARLTPYKTLDSTVDGIVLTFIDITERKAGEEALQWLSAVVSSSNDAIIGLALDGAVVSWNGGATRLFDYTPEEIIGHSAAVLSESVRPGEVIGLASRVVAGETITNFESEWARKSGERLAVSVSLSAIRTTGGMVRGVTAIVHDTTEQRRTRAEIDSLSRRKDEFLAMLAHELRNPLAPILSGIEVIRDAEGSLELIETAAGVIERQTLQMVRLVDDLLDVSRITQGSIRLQRGRVDVRTLIGRSMEASRSLIDAAGHVCHVVLPTRPVYIDADAARVEQVFVNLLTNAAKYTPAGGRIDVIVETGLDRVSVAVKDNGIGIAPDMIPRVFEMFTQIDKGRHHQRGGLGVGLNVVKTLVEMHGGTVDARSEGDGNGSEFTVHFPLAANQNVEPESAARPGPSVQADDSLTPPELRVLVVDDNVDAARMLVELLADRFHDVRTAHDGLSALRVAEEFRPDVCLLDIGLPDILGYEVARRLRAQDPEIHLIALTGWGHDDDRVRSREAGIDHHVVKPAEFAVLDRLIAEGRAGVAG